MKHAIVAVMLLSIAACSSSSGSSSSPDDATTNGDTSPADSNAGDSAPSGETNGDDANDAIANADTGAIGDDGGGASRAIGEWTDAPGACPAGATRVDVTTVKEMEDDSRGDAHPEGTCFFVHNGVYVQEGSTLPLYFLRGGTKSAPITWVGESRAGVVIHGRATFSKGDISLSNMTFDLTGYSQSGAFNTITVDADDITISHVTLTGDCKTGSQGGHIEVDDGVANTLVDSCLVEKFGNCFGTGDNGHLDHGIYLAAGKNIVVRNNVIRGNSSRGIQLNTESGAFGTLDTVLIEDNRIYENGHRDYEDGIVLNGASTGTITNVTIRHNLIYRNYYSGVRFSGDAMSGISIDHDTFVGNGAASTAPGKSELNLDDGTPTATATGNIFAPNRTVVNACAGALSVTDNVVNGDAAGACVTKTIAADPQFFAPSTDDYHTHNPVVAAYGAYAP